jgi:hypothetical protein
VVDLRLRSFVTEHQLAKMVGKLLTDDERSVELTGAATVRKPNGKLLCIYLPQALKPEMEDAWDALSSIREQTTNRGYASAAPTFPRHGLGTSSRRTGAKVLSGIIGAYDENSGPMAKTCRLTAFTSQNTPKVEAITPILKRMDELFREHVGDRYEAQRAYADRTHPEWLIPGTVYTTITVNNTYATGVHTDKGDLDEGFSCLAVARKGLLDGGVLTFPRYGVGVNLQMGDLLLMDAHEYHGNTPLSCSACGDLLHWANHNCGQFPGPTPERVSLVAYYRTRIEKCGTREEEQAKRIGKREANNARALGLS